MNIEGPKRLVKRAVFAAVLLGIKQDFTLFIVKGKESFCIRNEDGSYLIVVDKKVPKFFHTEIIAHEMVHLRQFLRGDLQEPEEGFVIWRGERMIEPPFMSDGYFLAPWEMEARALEDWITHRWENRKNELH